MSVSNISSSGNVGATNSLPPNTDVMTGLFLLQLQQVEVMDKQLLMQQQDMKARNDTLKALNEVISELRKLRPDDDKKKATIPKDLAEAAAKLGLDIKQGEFNQGQFTAFIENAKGRVDVVSNESQVDMIRLNSLVGKRNRTFEMISNLQNKVAQTLGTIVRNMG